MTIDELAQIIKSGFDETATKTDLRDLGKRVDSVEEHMDRGFNFIVEETKNMRQTSMTSNAILSQPC